MKSHQPQKITRSRPLSRFVVLLCIIVCPALWAEFERAPSSRFSSGLTADLINDHRNFYSQNRLLRLGLAYGVGAIKANSSFDNKFQERFQDNVRNSATDILADSVDFMGDGRLIIPMSLAMASLSIFWEDSAFGDFGSMASRSYLVGTLPLLAKQRIAGAGRPEEHDRGARWRFLDDDNSVSGHAFIGAVPFLVLARMNEQNNSLKYLFYICSLATAFARVNNDNHYFSQAALGWFLAYEATGAVFGQGGDKKIKVIPIANNHYGLMIYSLF